MNTNDVLLAALPDFSSDELDDVAHDGKHSRRLRAAAMQEIARRRGEAALTKTDAWRRIVDHKPAYVQRARERQRRRDSLRGEAIQIARRIGQLWQLAMYGEDWNEAVASYSEVLLARRIGQLWQLAMYGEDWNEAVASYSEVLRLRDRENAIDVELGEKKRRVQIDSSPEAATAALRQLRNAKAAETDALEARQREWWAEEERRDRGGRLPRRRPAYMSAKIRRPPSSPGSASD